MSDGFVFQPEQRLGVFFQVTAILFFAGAATLGVFQAALASIGPIFLLFLLPVLLALAAVPLLLYRLYGLLNASYTLEREEIRLRWGLRVEDIPITSVLWVHPASDLAMKLPLPWLRWPGALLGVCTLPGAGEVEFLASRSQHLVLIGTAERIYAVSPANPQAFLLAFQRLTEMGSLAPSEARSVYPTLLLSRVWSAAPARLLLLTSLTLSLALWVWVSLAIPGRAQASLGFLPDRSPGELGPAVRLLLLPVINTFFFLSDTFLGLFFFRREDNQALAYLLWGAGAITPLLFLMAVFFILRVG